MKKVYYVDISNVVLEDIKLNLISIERINKSNLIHNDLKKIQSLTSYLLLKYVFRQLNINLNDYQFKYVNNKPYIDLEYHFNITHSKNIVAIVVSDSGVGLDCEVIDSSRSLTASKYLFTNKEYDVFNLLEGVEKIEYFYKTWVMKETHFKMSGKGLTKEFSSLDDLNYSVFKIVDLEENSYFISCSTPFVLKKIDFNIIND